MIVASGGCPHTTAGRSGRCLSWVKVETRSTIGGEQLDHLVGAGEEGGRDRDAERLRSLEVDDELEGSGLLNGQVAWLFASYNTVGQDHSTGEVSLLAWAICHEQAGSRVNL